MCETIDRTSICECSKNSLEHIISACQIIIWITALIIMFSIRENVSFCRVLIKLIPDTSIYAFFGNYVDMKIWCVNWIFVVGNALNFVLQVEANVMASIDNTYKSSNSLHYHKIKLLSIVFPSPAWLKNHRFRKRFRVLHKILFDTRHFYFQADFDKRQIWNFHLLSHKNKFLLDGITESGWI